MNDDLERIIKEENLNLDKTYKFIQNYFRDYEIKTYGTNIKDIKIPIFRFD